MALRLNPLPVLKAVPEVYVRSPLPQVIKIGFKLMADGIFFQLNDPFVVRMFRGVSSRIPEPMNQLKSFKKQNTLSFNESKFVSNEPNPKKKRKNKNHQRRTKTGWFALSTLWCCPPQEERRSSAGTNPVPRWLEMDVMEMEGMVGKMKVFFVDW